MNDFIYYKVGDKTAKVSSDKQQFFEEKYPDAKILYSYEGRTAAVPLGQRDSFLSKYGADKVTYAAFDEEEKKTPDANDGMILDEQPSFAPADDEQMTRRERRQARREERANDDNVTLRETIKNAYGVNRATLPKYVIDLANVGLKTRALSPEFNISDIVEGVTGKSVYDPNAPLNRASQWLGERAEEKSKAADPTHGEKGYWELLKDFQLGKIGKKAIGQTIQSAPMMAAASSGFGSLLLGAGMSASEFEDTKRERPEIDDWKNLLYSVGTTATEFAVERLGGPLKNLLSGGAKKLTKEAAEEIIEKVTKESEKSIAERILKRITKEGIEEGGEEVLTLAANDALGEALDRLDGQQDYGFAAQWESFKEENPEATKWDFAKNKGKEILEAFLGGGFAGAMMSGASTPVSEFGNKQSRDSFQRAKEVGAAMDYRDMYDVKDEVQQATDKASKSFVDANGEQTISAEFIETLSADDAFNLSQSEDVPFEQKTALMELAYAKAKQEGLERKLDERTLGQINANKALIEGAAQNGKVTIGQVEGRNVYVVGGTVNNGKVTLPDGQDGPIVVLDTQTGDKIYVRTDDITGAGVFDAKALGDDIEQSLIDADNAAREQARNTMSPRAKANAVQPYKGKKILVDVGNGVTEVYVQEITPNGEVIIKGKKGDLGGQSFLTLNTSTFYDSIYRDGDGNPVVTDAGPEVEETPVEGAPLDVTENDDFRDFTGTIVVNGTPLDVEVVSQDNPSNSIVYKYTDANGVERRGNATIGDFKAAIQAAESTTQQVDTTPTETTDVTPTEEVPETTGEVAPETPVETPTETPVEEAPVDETPAPQTTDWKALFEANPNEYLRELQRQYGDRAAEIIRDEIAALEEELEALEKNRGKDMNERMANLDKKGELKLNIGILKELLWDLQKNPSPQPVAETPVETPAPAEEAPVAETPAEETPPVETPIEEVPVAEAPVVEAPAPVEETPTEEAPTDATPTEPAHEAPTEPETPSEPEAPTEEPQPAVPTTPAPETPTTPAPKKPVGKTASKSGTLSRIIAEAKAKVAKIAAKAKIKDFALDDDTLPVLGGVLRKGGYEYASDTHILAKIKSTYPAEQEGKIYSVKTGQEITGRFPNADMVISSSERVNQKTDIDIDDVLATAQAAEELKKGFDKGKAIYVRVGRSLFRSDLLLKAASMAKAHGLTTISQHPSEDRNMLFSGENGTVVIVPISERSNMDIIDSASGEATFDDFATLYVKVPTTLKGIETARTTIQAILPHNSEAAIKHLKGSSVIKLENGKVFYSFLRADIAKAKGKAKDPNTYKALEDIEENGLEIPMSQSEIAKIFPEAVPAAPATPANPVAPKSVANPIQEAQNRERSLATQLKRVDISPEQKRDMAFNAGKAIGDLFATREEYEAYAENATDLGEYNSDFERGVDESFANRGQNSGETPKESVPLENQPEVDDNGEKGETPQGDTTVQRHRGGDIPRTSDGEGEGGNKGAEKGQKQAGKNTKGKKSVEDKYPARKGNATGKLLVDTFGFDSVTIPDSRKDTLNTIYDFMMEMAKMLGISPKSIGNGGWLGVANLRANSGPAAAHSYSWRGQSIVSTILKFKYAHLSGIAHEWLHSLDHALVFFNTGKGLATASEIPSSFDGRKETLDAVKGVMDAIKASGHLDRIAKLGTSLSHLIYLRKPTEQAARAFEQYITDKFAEAGIKIDGYSAYGDPSYPTAEEMKVIAPAFDKLFEVLKEKAGKKPDTSVLYHIGNEVDQMEAERNVSDEAKQLAAQAVAMQLAGNEGIDFAAATDEETEQMMEAAGAGAEFMVADDKPVFVSNAAVAVMGIKQEKATPEQWLKMIEKAGGLKAGEDKWMLLSDWLKESDTKTLTKQEVLDFIKENTIQIEEVNYAEINYVAEDKKLIAAVNDEFLALRKEAQDSGEGIYDAADIAYQQMIDRYGDDFSIAFGVDLGTLYVSNRRAASVITGVDLGAERDINETRIGYTTYGLDNLKEIALTVPTIEPWNQNDEIHFGDAGEGRAVAWVRFGETEVTVQDAAQQRLNEIYDRLDELEMKVSSSTGITMEEYEERARLREERDRLQEIEPKTQKVLVIDEIQSKRHQEGREKGYKSDFDFSEKEKERIDRLESMYARRGELVREKENNEEEELTRLAQIDIELDSVQNVRDYDRLTAERDAIVDKRKQRYNEINELRREIYRAEDELATLKVGYNFDYSVAIPDAPFEKNWHELAMKRMLRYAAENGYDAIAWTKGEQQAERYSLAKSFNGIEREDRPDGEGGRRFTLYGHNMETIYVDESGKIASSSISDELTGKQLSEVVGKDMAAKMMSLENNDIIEGEDLKIGGEGMKGFYDKILPAFMNKYGKKWGVKVSDITLPNVEEAGRVMHSVPVNEAMKDSVMEGQPMFMKRPNGKVYGWAQGNSIRYTKDGFNPNTLTHEYTHLWAKAMMLKNPKGWQSVKDLLRGTPVWNEVLNDANYSDIHSDEDLVASEVLSRISGREGAAKLEQMAQQMIDEAKGTMRKLEARGLVQRIKDALNEFWSWVGVELFGIEKFESVEQVADRVLWDLMNQTDLGDLSDGLIENERYGFTSREIAAMETPILSSKGTFKNLSEAEEWAKSNLQGKSYVNRFTNDTISISGKSIKEMLNPNTTKKISESVHMAALMSVPEFIETGIPAEQHKDTHNRGFDVIRLYNAIEIDGKVYRVKSTVKRLKEGDRYYTYEIQEMELIEDTQSTAVGLNGNPVLNSTNSITGANLLKKVRKTNSSEYILEEDNFQDDGLLFRSSYITPEMDAEYLAAVESGDMETAQRLVDEAAKLAMPNTKVVDENGDPKVVYHQTNQKVYINRETGQNWDDVDWKERMEWEERDDWEDYWEEQDFNTFSRVNARTTNEFDGFFFAPEYDEYHEYGDRTIPAFLNIENPASRDDYNIDASKNDAGRDERIRLQEAGFDGVIRMDGDVVDEYIAFEPSQIKSAEAVTYDDNGNVIPLSERFNPENPDIRYRTINEGETDLEFVQSAVADFLSQYKSPVPMTAVDVNDKAAVEVAIGFEVDELSDESYQMLVDKVNNGGRSIYVADTKRIVIFADARNEISADVDESSFHEITHALADKNPAILELGEWLWNNADKGVRKKVKDIVLSNGYPAEQYHNEMLARFTGVMLALGGAGKVMPILPIEQHKHWNYILNEIGYDPERDDESRRERHSVDSSRRRSNRQMASATLPDNGDARNVKEARQNEAVGRLVGTARSFAIEHAVNEEAAKLGVKVTYKTREDMPKGHKNDKGYYNTKTGEIVICTENATSVADAIQTILHEAVAHKGLRQLMGDKFNEFINRVYNSLDAKTKAKVDALADKSYNGNKAVAMEEYLASLAEKMDFENKSVWDKVKSIFGDIINAILGRSDIKIGDNELRYILRASYNHMVNPRGMDSLRGWAQDQMMREEYKINEASPELLSRTGIDPDEVATETARMTYDRVVSDQWQEFQRQFQDAMQPMRIAIDAIQQETGNIPVEDYENYLLMQNQSSSRSRVEIDDFSRRYYSPIIKQVNSIIDKILESRGLSNSRKNRSTIYLELINYLIAKHGLERNKYYQTHKQRLLNAAEKKEAIQEIEDNYSAELARIASTYTGTERANQENIAKQRYEAELAGVDSMTTFDVRDYSGLTALFGLEPKEFEMAEIMAKEAVDKFEAVADTAELWKAINAATDKTLRHSYECGLLSRQQYNDIKSMYNFYIPLRGFRDLTAEDVYAYARFEDNSFSPAVAETKGRTSVADDPIAFIMNMAESEIAQGNKNRAKQALYNFLLNRPVVDANGNQKQNSLMQVESVWYVKSKDDKGNEVYTIAAPDHANGETYEEFEARMQTLSNNDMAFKSKKGQVDVGVRFQKQTNKNAHYIYLKVNGVDKAIYVNGDPKAADAVNGAYHHERGKIAEKMGQLNRIVSSTFTNYSLEFTARNYFRDMVYSHINIGVRESDPAYRTQFRKNWRHNNIRAMLKMLNAYRAGEFEGRTLNADEAAFVEFMNNGGQTGYTLINSVENHKKDLERAIARMQNGIVKGGVKDSAVFRYTLGGIELLNEASELVTRFAAYKTSRDMGRGVNKSISDAKEITVNFNTKGAQDGSNWMGAVARYFGWSKYFFNASVQGVQNIKAMAEANKLKFCTTVGSIAAAGFLVPVITAALSELLGGDEEEYWNIPEYDRQNNFCVVVGDRYVKIPLPIGFREMYAIGDMVAAGLYDKNFTRDIGQVGTDIANKIASVTLPINPLESAANGLSIWHTALYTALPSTAQFAIQNMTNTDWKGVPLQKEYQWNKDDPNWMKAYASNPDWMTGLSKWCNEHINLDGDFEYLDRSPEKLDNTLSNLFGGVYSLIKKTGQSLSMIWNEENRNLSNIPLAGVVLGSGIDSDERFVENAFYEMQEYYDGQVNIIKRTAKKHGYELEDILVGGKGVHIEDLAKIYANKEFNWVKEWYLGVEGNPDGKSKNEKLGISGLAKAVEKQQKKVDSKKNPAQNLTDELIRLQNEYANERRRFVDHMLEIE